MSFVVVEEVYSISDLNVNCFMVMNCESINKLSTHFITFLKSSTCSVSDNMGNF